MRQQYAPIAYNCYYIVSIGYTMAATKLSLNQCKTFQSPVICDILNRVGINRNVSRNIIFGPKRDNEDSKCITFTLSKEPNT
jgi:hypothetical protein